MSAALDRTTFLARLAPESHFHRLFDSLPDVLFFAKDADGRLLFADRGLLRLYGLETEEELVGRKDAEFLPRGLAEKYRRDDLQVMRTLKPMLGMVELFLSPLGIPAWYLTDKLPLIGVDGVAIGVMGTLRQYAAAEPSVPQLQPAITRMREDLARDDSVAELASLCQLSTRQFENRFKAVYNTSPTSYRIRLRLTRACELLIRSSASIADVALASGFYDQSALARHFRAILGVTPLQYRRRYRS
jgi:AraC-like DNA-binding protein